MIIYKKYIKIKSILNKRSKNLIDMLYLNSKGMINMGNRINVTINKQFSLSANTGVTIKELAHEYEKVSDKIIIGARMNDSIVDFDTKIMEDTNIEFFDYTDSSGNKMYQAGLKFVMIIAVKELWNKSVTFKFSIDKGIFAEIDKRLTDQDIEDLRIKMNEIISYDYPIKRCVTRKLDAIRYYLSTEENEKCTNVRNIPNNYVELYEINHSYNYFYTDMPYSTKALGFFSLERIEKNAIALMYPHMDSKNRVPKYDYNEKIYKELVTFSKWAEKHKVSYAAGINDLVADSKIQRFVKMNNIFLNDSLSSIAKDISKKIKSVKVILIGGPSSSGKTTSAHRMCTYLETFGVKPIIISADDYFKERVDSPRDENGNYDFERLDALDLDLFNSQLKSLLAGEEVVIPTFNFLTGEKEYKRPPIKMNDDNVLLIEGLHCLNEKMTKSISRDLKYKIFVCPLTPLGIDRHNHLSTTDMRLIRRIVRDNRVRGYEVEETLKSWGTVKAGEEKYIFPFTADVDAVLNTAYTYEVGILRVFAEPLLYSIKMDSPYYEEGRRLIGILQNFFPISSEYIEDDNTLREFIGGSIYE